MNREIFREYDIRGVVGIDLTERAGAGHRAGLRHIYAGEGQDEGISSEGTAGSAPTGFGALVTEGMAEGGLSVIDLGVVPTPVFYYSLFKLDVEGGIMVTGSHNPPDYNGFKVAFGKSTLFGAEVQEIGNIVEARRFVSGRRDLIHAYSGLIARLHRVFVHKHRHRTGPQGGGRRGQRDRRGRRLPHHGRPGPARSCPSSARWTVVFPNHFPDPTVERNLDALEEHRGALPRQTWA